MTPHPNMALDQDLNPIHVQFKNWKCWLEFTGRYAPQPPFERGALALRLRMVDAPKDDTDLVATATVNVELGPDEYETSDLLANGPFVLIKDWSENAGMLAALEAAGVVEDTGQRIPTGRVEAALCHLLIPVPALLKEAA